MRCTDVDALNGRMRTQTTKKIKMVTRERKVSKKIRERREWEKFGAVKEVPRGPEENVTYVSKEDIRIERPENEAKSSKQDEENLIKKLREGMMKREFNKRMAEQGLRPADEQGPGTGGIGGLRPGGLRTGTPLSEAFASSGGGGGGLAAASASGTQKYVPPHMLKGANKFAERDGEQNTLRVTNISEDTTERDLQELFRPFGHVTRTYLAKDRETHMSRGFAYVSYARPEDAQRAMEKLNGYGYDHLILKVEWAKPSSKDDVASQNVLQRGFATGYGGALPQGLGN